MKRIVKEALLIVIISSAIGFLVNTFHPHKVAISKNRPAIEYAPDSLVAQELPPISMGGDDTQDMEGLEANDGPPIVSTDQVRQLIESGRAILLDARNDQEYKTGHIPGAIHFPFENLDEYSEKLNSLPKDKWLITYCDGPPCDLGELLAYELFAAGYTHVAVYQDGMNAWVKTEKIAKGGS